MKERALRLWSFLAVLLAVAVVGVARPALAQTPPPAPGSVEGQVVNKAGEGVKAFVFLHSSTAHGFPFGRGVVTDDSGKFSIRAVRPGDYVAAAQARGLAGRSDPFKVEAGKTTTITITVLPVTGHPPPPPPPPSGSAKGACANEGGDPVGGAMVVARSAAPTPFPGGPSTFSRPDGSWGFPFLREGDYTFHAAKFGVGRGEAKGTVKAGQTTDVGTITLVP